MTHIWQGLGSGRWLTAERARGYSLILLGAYVIAIAGRITLSDGLVDRNAVGTDFSAGTLCSHVAARSIGSHRHHGRRARNRA